MRRRVRTWREACCLKRKWDILPWIVIVAIFLLLNNAIPSGSGNLNELNVVRTVVFAVVIGFIFITRKQDVYYYCNKCSKRVGLGDKYCRNCGEKF